MRRYSEDIEQGYGAKLKKRRFGRRDSDRGDRGNRGGFRRDSPRERFGGRGRFDEDSQGRGERRHLEMHEITCAKCGKISEVPFLPKTDKPVYCRECFNQNERQDSRRQLSSPNQLDEINAKLDKILRVLKAE
jgi:CxxC-x17-CxxC domain-containing protein